MLEKRGADAMGATSFRGANSVHHFCYGRYQSAERMHWSNLRMLNRVRLDPHARRDPNFLGNMTVVLLAEVGEIEIQCGARKVRIAAGECALLAMGMGADYGIANLRGMPSKFLEIWFNAPEPCGLSDGADIGPFQGIASMRAPLTRAELCALSDEYGAQISLLALADGESADRQMECEYAYLTVIAGEPVIGGVQCATGDAIALHDEAQLALVGKGACEILLIELLEDEQRLDLRGKQKPPIGAFEPPPNLPISIARR